MYTCDTNNTPLPSPTTTTTTTAAAAAAEVAAVATTTNTTTNNNGHIYGAWSLAKSKAQSIMQKHAQKDINIYNTQNTISAFIRQIQYINTYMTKPIWAHMILVDIPHT